MSFHDDREIQRRRKPDPTDDPETSRSRPKKRRPIATDVGDALRTVYQRTVNEDIPPEMLDLLGKLG